MATKIRATLAQLVWLACALAALCYAEFASTVFSRQDGIKQFRGEGAEVKNALFNWGLAAIAWLVAGRVLYRVIKP